MLIEIKDLIMCFLIVGLFFSIYRNVRDEKDNYNLGRRVSELECRLVVRAEDRITLLEQAIDELQKPKELPFGDFKFELNENFDNKQ